MRKRRTKKEMEEYRNSRKISTPPVIVTPAIPPKQKRHRRTKKEMEEARLTSLLSAPLLKPAPKQAPAPPVIEVHHSPPPKRRRRRTKAEMLEAKKIEVAKAKVERPVVVAPALESLYATLFVDRVKLNQLSQANFPEVIDFTQHCISKRYSNLEYSKDTISKLQKVLDLAFKDTYIKVEAVSMKVTVGDLLIKESFARMSNDSFFIKIIYNRKDIKVSFGSNTKVNETLLLNEIHSLIAKDFRRSLGITDREY